ncbi:hypothetical protein BFJ63_vAg18723 [Fusarium oxysporum f. sp. narcissi]|uniref:Uncharacterized protein n=1 Tax=Fusarium oxysporum f. sp. narcissi TaxID=451672 RepID=A0A4Q2V267_FUSOX|nr:hypothetical protein BFJ63_vAg18723 [Fusarium oxysporum f. sp. narcissi]
MAPRPVAAEHARQRNCRKAKDYRERLRQRKQARDCQTDVQIESVNRNDECAELIHESSPEASSVAYEAFSQVVAEPTATASMPSCPNVSRSRAGTENGEPIPQGPGDPTNFATYSHGNTAEAPEVSEQPNGEDEEFASSTDPMLIRREQTRLRVQRYRARQHKLRLEAAAATSDPLNTVGYTS